MTWQLILGLKKHTKWLKMLNLTWSLTCAHLKIAITTLDIQPTTFQDRSTSPNLGGTLQTTKIGRPCEMIHARTCPFSLCAMEVVFRLELLTISSKMDGQTSTPHRRANGVCNMADGLMPAMKLNQETEPQNFHVMKWRMTFSQEFGLYMVPKL